MSDKMKQTRYRNHTIQIYDKGLVAHLNQVTDRIGHNNDDLANIGSGLHSYVGHKIIYVGHRIHPTTEDNYTWFGSLEFAVDGSLVHVLFPWHQDWNSPKSKMDRSINVYTSNHIPAAKIFDLLEQLAYQMTLYRHSSFESPLQIPAFRNLKRN